jgi:hypothetical protein
MASKSMGSKLSALRARRSSRGRRSGTESTVTGGRVRGDAGNAAEGVRCTGAGAAEHVGSGKAAATGRERTKSKVTAEGPGAGARGVGVRARADEARASGRCRGRALSASGRAAFGAPQHHQAISRIAHALLLFSPAETSALAAYLERELAARLERPRRTRGPCPRRRTRTRPPTREGG